jgi:hypothetical protein
VVNPVPECPRRSSFRASLLYHRVVNLRRFNPTLVRLRRFPIIPQGGELLIIPQGGGLLSSPGRDRVCPNFVGRGKIGAGGGS